MAEPVKEALAAARRAQGAIGNTPVFSAPKDPTKPCSLHPLGIGVVTANPKINQVS
jgi:hypothetical protein